MAAISKPRRGISRATANGAAGPFPPKRMNYSGIGSYGHAIGRITSGPKRDPLHSISMIVHKRSTWDDTSDRLSYRLCNWHTRLSSLEKLMQFCAEHGCGELVPRGRCQKHLYTRDRARGTFRERGYTSRWDRRSAHFRSIYPLCGMRPNGQKPVMSQCYTEHRTTRATQVDHVIPHKGDPVLMWDELGNWQSLCSACHMRKTAAGK